MFQHGGAFVHRMSFMKTWFFKVGLVDLHRALASTPLKTFGINWYTDLLTQHQCLTWLMLLWWNDHKSLKTRSKIIGGYFNKKEIVWNGMFNKDLLVSWSGDIHKLLFILCVYIEFDIKLEGQILSPRYPGILVRNCKTNIYSFLSCVFYGLPSCTTCSPCAVSVSGSNSKTMFLQRPINNFKLQRIINVLMMEKWACWQCDRWMFCSSLPPAPFCRMYYRLEHPYDFDWSFSHCGWYHTHLVMHCFISLEKQIKHMK